MQGTSDYIFYTKETLHPRQVMTLPDSHAMHDADPRRPATVPDLQDSKPKNWDDRERPVRQPTNTHTMN